MYTRNQLRLLWREIFLDGQKIEAYANIIVSIIQFWIEQNRWPTMVELAESMFNVEVTANPLGDSSSVLAEMICTLRKSGHLNVDIDGLFDQSKTTWKSTVSLSPARISNINEILRENGLPPLPEQIEGSDGWMSQDMIAKRKSGKQPDGCS